MFDNVTLFISFFTFPFIVFFFFSSRRRHTRCGRDWSFRRVLFRSIDDRNIIRRNTMDFSGTFEDFQKVVRENGGEIQVMEREVSLDTQMAYMRMSKEVKSDLRPEIGRAHV